MIEGNSSTSMGFGRHLALDLAHNKHLVDGIAVANNKNNNRVIQDLYLQNL